VLVVRFGQGCKLIWRQLSLGNGLALGCCRPGGIMGARRSALWPRRGGRASHRERAAMEGCALRTGDVNIFLRYAYPAHNTERWNRDDPVELVPFSPEGPPVCPEPPERIAPSALAHCLQCILRSGNSSLSELCCASTALQGWKVPFPS